MGVIHNAGAVEIGAGLDEVALCNRKADWLGDSFPIAALLAHLLVELDAVLFRAVANARDFVIVPPSNPIDVLPRFEAAFALNTVHVQ